MKPVRSVKRLNKNAAGDCGVLKREKFVQATGAIPEGGTGLKPLTLMYRMKLPERSYRIVFGL